MQFKYECIYLLDFEQKVRLLMQYTDTSSLYSEWN